MIKKLLHRVVFETNSLKDIVDRLLELIYIEDYIDLDIREDKKRDIYAIIYLLEEKLKELKLKRWG
jgi:hypothetical protein